MSKPHAVRRKLDRSPRLSSRALALRIDAGSGRPASLDEESRSVEVTASTEAPALVMDWERWEPVNEVLLMSGCRLPEGGVAPLLDTHSRCSVRDVIGSFRDIRVEQSAAGPVLAGRIVFSATDDGEKPFRKVAEGHVTDVSVGYEVLAHVWVKENETTTVEGKTFTGPLRIGTDWAVRELSLCPIGADANAKVRADNTFRQTPANAAGHHNKETAMSKPKTGGKNDAARKAGLLAGLRKILGLLAEEDEDQKDQTEAERQDVEIVDEEGAPIDPAELTEEELEAVVKELIALEEEVEAELAAEEPPAEEQRKAARPSARTLAVLRAVRAQGGKAGGSASSGLGLRVERKRIAGIRNLAKAHNLSREMEDKLINSGASLERAKAQVLDMVTQRPSGGPGFQISMGTTEQEKFRSAAQDSLFIRCNLPLLKHAPGSEAYRREQRGQREQREATPGAHEMLALPLSMLCREALIRSGQSVPGDIRQIVGRALTTTDLPMLLVETSRRQLMEAFEAAEETWRLWCQTGIATDFKVTKSVGLEADMKPKLKHEYGEYEQGELAENVEEWFIEEFGRMITISRQALINDDLDALTQIPTECGVQTAEMVGDVAYQALLSTPNTMGDGKPLFHADHLNLHPGLGGVPTVQSLGRVVTQMKLQQDSFSRLRPQVPRFFIAPVSLETAAEQFFLTQLNGEGVIGTGASPLVHNQFAGNRFARVYDHRLDLSDAGAWYLAAQRATVRVFFLGGMEAPYIDSEVEFNSDAVKTKVRMDVGAKAMRWITMAKATPAP